ncbi:hypothetical protein [Edwardsiella phage vB_EtaM_ET-ABTNL-9]|nr:hypothetical protein [Edwardsiella phage vB_EtaM_ET-ABTNL-9]
MVAHLLKNMVGKVYKTNGGTDCTIIEYTNSKDIKVRFNDEHGYTTKAVLSSLKEGSVRNPYDKTVAGVGYIGVGKYKPSYGGKATVAYEHWRSMLLRCYCERSKSNGPTYRGCTVCDEWLNFQNFARWYYSQKFKECGYHLDKDILLKGNKHYSPETCCLVPREINATIKGRLVKGMYLQGVCPYNNTGKFKAYVGCGGKTKTLGVYDTEEDAHQAYKAGKEYQVKALALEWKDEIGSKVYEALMNWTAD